MNRQQLVKRIAEDVDISQTKARMAVDAVLLNIEHTLADGRDVRLSNFGTFKTVERAPKTARNPQTGETVMVPARITPVFKPSKTLKDSVA